MRNVRQNATIITLEAKINDLSCSIKDNDAASPGETDKDNNAFQKRKQVGTQISSILNVKQEAFHAFLLHEWSLIVPTIEPNLQ